MRYVARAALAVGLLVGLYVVAVALVLGLAWAVIEVGRLGAGLAAGKLLIIALPVASAVLYGLFGRGRPDAAPGVALSEAAQTRLWTVIRESAELASTRCVDEVRLVAEANAAVTDSTTWLGLRPGRRRLYLGVPLVLGLDEAQLRSVLAHEFGHYSGKHTVLSPITFRGAESLRRILERLGSRHVIGWLFSAYARLYFAVAHAVNRRQELEADELSARAVGPEVAASALLRVRELALLWDRYVALFAPLGRDAGQRPSQLLVGFADYLADAQVRTWIDEVLVSFDEPKPSTYDTHPPFAQRVARLTAMGGDVLGPFSGRPGPASDLLDELTRTLADVEEDLYPPTGLEPIPLRELVSASGRAQLLGRALMLDKLLQEQGRAPDVAALIRSLRNGSATLLFQRHLRDDADLPAATAELLGDYLGAALIDAGQAHARLDWLSGWVLVDSSDEPLELPDLIGEVLATPGRVEDLAELLRLLGVADTWRPSEPARETTTVPTAAGQVVGVVSPVSFARTLVVSDAGLLVLTANLRDRLATAARMNGREAQALLERYEHVPAAELVRTRKGRIIAWHAITALHVRPRGRRRALVTVSVVDGADLVVKVQKNSEEAGHAWRAARHFLGDRYVRTETLALGS